MEGGWEGGRGEKHRGRVRPRGFSPGAAELQLLTVENDSFRACEYSGIVSRRWHGDENTSSLPTL